ncbi:MAG: esterase [Candidatus Tectimicrobiota bacterium]|nr:MAG: esterase [Candidatus Tectomicrobia bacterium]
MPLDPQARQVLEQLAALGLPPAHTVTPEEARRNMKARPRAAGPDVAKVETRLLPGPAGPLPVRLYTPPGRGPFPVLMWFHGGGWVVGDLDTADPTARHLCVGAGCVVVSVDYRLAPEAKFPAAAEDCYAATCWVAQHAAEIGGEAERIAVGGDSAGGNLATVVALMARDRGTPSLVFQLLVYPVTARHFETASYQRYAEGYLLLRDTMRWYWDQYLNRPEEAQHPYAAPLLASDLRGLPPALVITAECDPLCDEGEAYARRLQEAGVPTAYRCYEGMIHGFFAMPELLDKGKEALAEASAALRQAFATAAARPV